MNALREASLHTLVLPMIYSQDHDMQCNNDICFLREPLGPMHEPQEVAAARNLRQERGRRTDWSGGN